MASNTKKKKFYIHLLLRPVECTKINNLAHCEERLDIPGLTY